MQPLADFLTKTHDHLGTLVAQARIIRRNLPAGHACPDTAACRGCAALRDLHICIDDDLDQLELAALDPDPEPVDCIACARRRYTDGLHTACPACDGLACSGRTWTPIPDREPA